MKKQKYTMKHIQKLKKKKSSTKQLHHRFATKKSPKPKMSPKGRFEWKWPATFVIGLSFIILAVPTLIVLPFISNNEVHSKSVDQPPKYEEVLAEESAVEVAVMRTQTDQIENVPLETYVSGVVASEMPIEFEKEALKAQALAARTYIVNKMLYQEENADSDVTDTIFDQVYKNDTELRAKWGANYNKNMEKISQAVSETKGQIITYNEKPIDPQFFSTSNGFTENSEDYYITEIPYLRSVPSPWDEISPYYVDQETFTFEQVEAALDIDLPDNENLVIESTRTESNRIAELNLAGNQFTGREVREKLELRSNDFTIEQKDNYLIFTTRGNGHGVGMSQYGANGMAQEGKTYEDIIKYYYKDVEITTLDIAAPALVMK
ncbi:stage II sporulation protein D [Ornithinibacillus halotolerans]|uniref:Stage II sporulation protein D n=1 Tax=Ornithinibacillus halotolerans TaxID=1274357 RepID=A0A916W492_9BACI|nr:stage II sporulation protein D [Ornithinibacillus halotolerans]GGA64436.1 stage II sporulation protein D [Ornithinibacillus halotolerans]